MVMRAKEVLSGCSTLTWSAVSSRFCIVQFTLILGKEILFSSADRIRLIALNINFLLFIFHVNSKVCLHYFNSVSESGVESKLLAAVAVSRNLPGYECLCIDRAVFGIVIVQMTYKSCKDIVVSAGKGLGYDKQYRRTAF